MGAAKAKAVDDNQLSTRRRKAGAWPAQSKRYQARKHSLHPLKARIRDLRRQLLRNGNDMPANLRVDKERELQAYEHDCSIAEAERLKQEMIPRYHKIRFFERQKATRFLRKATKQLKDNSDPERHALLEREKHTCQVDLNYTLYYPLIRPYVSLYVPSRGTRDAIRSSTTMRVGGDKEMWGIVESKMYDGTLKALRNSLEWRQYESERATSPLKSFAVKFTTGSKEKLGGKRKGESDDESGGGFFE